MRPVLLSDTVHTDSFTAHNNNNHHHHHHINNKKIKVLRFPSN